MVEYGDYAVLCLLRCTVDLWRTALSWKIFTFCLLILNTYGSYILVHSGSFDLHYMVDLRCHADCRHPIALLCT